MGSYDKSVISLSPPHCCFISDSVSFFGSNLPRHEGLPDLICDHVTAIFSSGILNIIPLGYGELLLHKFGITFIAADQLTVIRLIRVLGIIKSVLDTLKCTFSLPLMHRDQFGCSHFVLLYVRFDNGFRNSFMAFQSSSCCF